MDHLKDILTARTAGPAEIVLAVTMLAVGLPLLLPPAEFVSYPGYALMGRVGAEAMWGSVLTSIALLRIYATLVNHLKCRKFLTLVSVIIWTFLCVLFLQAHHLSPWTSLFGAWALLESWTLVRVRRVH